MKEKSWILNNKYRITKSLVGNLHVKVEYIYSVCINLNPDTDYQLLNYNCHPRAFIDSDVKEIYEHGNCVLINIDDINYMCIGNDVIKFTTKAKLVSFGVRLLENYAYVIDENKNCYLIDRNVIISDIFNKLEETNSPDPYVLFFNHLISYEKMSSTKYAVNEIRFNN